MKNKLILLLALITGFGMQNAQATLRRVLPVVKSAISHSGFAVAPRRIFPTATKFVAQKMPKDITKAGFMRSAKAIAAPAAVPVKLMVAVESEEEEQLKARLSKYKYEVINKIEYDWLYVMAQQLCTQANIPVPILCFNSNYEGQTHATAERFNFCEGDYRLLISITKNLLTVLNRAELRTVVAHEIAHIKNGDLEKKLTTTTNLMTIHKVVFVLQASAFTMSTCAMADTFLFSQTYNLKVLALLSPYVYLAGFIAIGIPMFLRRSIEYAADKESVNLCKDPLAAVSAFQKTHDFDYKKAPESVSLMEKYNNLFCTHPLTKDRIARLEAMAAKMEAAKDKEELS